MKAEINRVFWHIRRGPSIFVERNGKEDVFIRQEVKSTANGGVRYEDGKLYRLARIVAADTGETLRDYCQIPEELGNDKLRDLGFLEPTHEADARNT